MAKASKRTTKQTIKKKKWVPIVAPKFLGEKEIGETYIEDISNSVGKRVSVNLMKVTGDIKTQSCTVKFEINEAKDNVLKTRIVSYEYQSSSLKRMVRRRMTRVDDSLVIMTKDNKKIRIKPMILTHGKVSKSVEYRIRLNAKTELIKYINNSNYDDIFLNVIKNNVQRDLKNILKSIHPMRTVLIRMLKEETHHASKISEAKPGKKSVSKKPKEKKEEKKKDTEAKTRKSEEKEVKQEEDKEEKKEKKEKTEKKQDKAEEKPKSKKKASKSTKK